MKKINTLFLTVSILLAVACGKEEKKEIVNGSVVIPKDGISNIPNSEIVASPAQTSLSSSTLDAGNALYGTWKYNVDGEDNGIKLKMAFSMKIQADKSILTNRCTVLGESIEVSVESAHRITDKTYEIIESKQAQKKVNGLTCKVSINSGKSNYTVLGNKLIFSKGGERFIFNQ